MGTTTIHGVTLRAWRHDDLAGMCDLINARVIAEGEGEPTTLEAITGMYDHLEHCDPATDIVVAVDADDRVVGYARTCWFDMVDGHRSYHVIFEGADGHPGCEGQLLDWSLSRGAEVAADHDHPDRRFDAMAADGSPRAAALGDRGFVPYAWSAMMVRPHLRDLPEAPLPAGLEMRPVAEDQLRTIWEADVEAFRDHRFEREQTDADWEIFRSVVGDTSLWHVAWDAVGIAGQVRTYVIDDESERLGRRRAWTESISTRRDWRGRGVASAVIVSSLRQLAALGYDEAALGVDLDNPTGALGVYERLGYRVVKRYSAYHRPIT